MTAKKRKIQYWQFQLSGWTLAALFWGYQAYFQGRFDFGIAALHFLLDILFGIGITHLYRYQTRSQIRILKPFNRSLPRIITSCLIFSGAFAVLVICKNYLMQQQFTPEYAVSFSSYFKSNAINVYVAGLRLLAIWILLYHLFHYVWNEIKVTQDNARLSLIAKDAQMANLEAQLNPHFLFNSLNTIKSLVLEDPHASRRAIDLLAEILRNGLYMQPNVMVTVNQEMDLVKDYIELEMLRFEERLKFDCHISHRASLAKMPSFSIMILAENAIKHGISKRKEGGVIRIEAEVHEDNLMVRVSNTGNIEPSHSVHGLGLKNLEERLELHFYGGANVEVIQKDNDIVVATLSIPYYE